MTVTTDMIVHNTNLSNPNSNLMNSLSQTATTQTNITNVVETPYIPLKNEMFSIDSVWRIEKTNIFRNNIVTRPVILDVQSTVLDIVNTSAVTDLFSYTVPGGTLGTNHAIRVQIKGDWLNNNGTFNDSFVALQIKYGATTMYDDDSAMVPVSANRRPVLLDFYLFANGTNSQSLTGYMYVGNGTIAGAGFGFLASDEIWVNAPIDAVASEDSTVDKNLKVVIQHFSDNVTPFANPLVSMRRFYSIVEKL